VTAVHVRPGHTTSRINGRLQPGGAIAGRITDATTHKGLTGGVEVFSAAGRSLASVESDARGRYVVKGLAATTTGDVVCALPDRPSAAISYLGRCWLGLPWAGGRLPAGTTRVPVTVGTTHGAINFALSRHRIKVGSIAGTITEKASGAPIRAATVEVFAPNGNDEEVPTDAKGHYVVRGLTATASGYQVCVQPATGSSATPTPDTGWSPACFDAAPWAGPGTAPSATLVPLKRGQAKTGVDIAVKVGGEISGAVTDAGNQQPVGGVNVKLFDAAGNPLASVISSFSDGSYGFPGLSPTALGYVVCFDGRRAVLGGSGYRPQCFRNIAWDGIS